jgi:SAM-dependent methyltransferase
VGAFRAHLPHAHFTGLDPFAPDEADSAVLRETAEVHASRHAASYDVVTAFQLIEHLAEPLRFVENMLRLLKPGGHLILCAPLHPSAMTALPNFLLNALPHHLTWWNQSALSALASHFSLDVEELSELEASPHEGVIHWMAKLCPVQAGRKDNPVYFAHRWSWHLGLGAAYAAARLAHRVMPLPRGSRPAAVFLAARKPE